MRKRVDRSGPARSKRRAAQGLGRSRSIVWVAPVLLISAASDSDIGPTTGGPVVPVASTSVGRTTVPKMVRLPSTRALSETRAKPLLGKVIAVDPGHNGRNWAAPQVVNRLVWNGREYEACDTSGTETGSSYTEARFNFNVARYLAADLEAEGATVVLTRHSNSGVGPCVTRRAAIANNAHADAAISIHADGGPATGRGFYILEPVADGLNDAVIAASKTLALDIRSAFRDHTGEPFSTYFGVNAVEPSDDLAALNLTTVPKVLIECANMRNPTDAALITTNSWQRRAARGLAAGLTAFLQRHGQRSRGHKHSTRHVGVSRHSFREPAQVTALSAPSRAGSAGHRATS